MHVLYSIRYCMHVIHDAKIIFYKKPVAWNCGRGRGYIKEKPYRGEGGSTVARSHRSFPAKPQKKFCQIQKIS